METINLTVNGMTCGACVKHVEKAISTVEGVQSVTVDLTTGSAKVEGSFPQGVAQILKALDEDGYPSVVNTAGTAETQLKSGTCKSGGTCCCN